MFDDKESRMVEPMTRKAGEQYLAEALARARPNGVALRPTVKEEQLDAHD